MSKAKSRLSALLGPQQRRELALLMLTHVIQASMKAKSVDGVVVVSSDNLILKKAREQGAFAIQDVDEDLNAAVARAMRWCAKRGATATLTIPSDLPLLRPTDIDEVVELVGEGGGVVLCPSYDGGTNALFCSPPNLIEPRFGSMSFYRHIYEASRRGLPYLIYESPRFSLDIDTPIDLKRLIGREVDVSTKLDLRRLFDLQV